VGEEDGSLGAAFVLGWEWRNDTTCGMERRLIVRRFDIKIRLYYEGVN